MSDIEEIALYKPSSPDTSAKAEDIFKEEFIEAVAGDRDTGEEFATVDFTDSEIAERVRNYMDD